MARKPSTVGEIIKKEYLEPMNMSMMELCRRTHSSNAAISRLLSGNTRLSIEMAFKLAKLFNTTEEFWLNLQRQVDLYEAKRDKELKATLKKIVPISKV
ncbi:plasmid antitoxin with HTH domain [Klebsiella phage Miami]|uniref:Transcriptional regulator n=1 Tax=Klebsiella phage Miami TaxID=2767581 RepID=A0A873WD05_9CAUD|nr:plasmid antitoxin with HTH domain [Klebsiella phage Miami]QPB09250.1 transcriptional regulator [Klebsiella phage Miami]